MDPTLVLGSQDAGILIGIAALLPMLVSVITKTHAPPWLKNGVNLALAAAVTAINEAFNAIEFTWARFASTLALTFAVSVLAYQKLWKDSPIHAGVAALTNRVGLNAGPTKPVNTDEVVLKPVVVEAGGTVSVAGDEIPVAAPVKPNPEAGTGTQPAGPLSSPVSPTSGPSGLPEPAGPGSSGSSSFSSPLPPPPPPSGPAFQPDSLRGTPSLRDPGANAPRPPGS